MPNCDPCTIQLCQCYGFSSAHHGVLECSLDGWLYVLIGITIQEEPRDQNRAQSHLCLLLLAPFQAELARPEQENGTCSCCKVQKGPRRDCRV